MISHTPALSHPKYRPDIDGLRAVAVLAVVCFHAFPLWLKGGFVGVDIFFVISGYLISSILFENFDKQSFSFREFYLRRIRRIFPSLLLVLLFCFVFGWFALLADEYKQLGKHLMSAAGFVSNITLYQEVGYFDNLAETKPLLHLWSLGVEEQFYIVWPVLLYSLWKRQFNLLSVTLLAAAISLLICLQLSSHASSAGFYLPHSRFWELLAGALLAWLQFHRPVWSKQFGKAADQTLHKIIYAQTRPSDGKTLANSLSVLGGLLLLASLFAIDKNTPFPGKFALLPVAAAMMLIAAGPEACLNRTILSKRVLVWVGLISFPLYLWHWPLLSFAHILEGGMPPRATRIAMVALAFLLAWCSYKWVERPLRFGNAARLKLSFLLIAMGVIAIIGYGLHRREGLEFRVKQFNKISRAAGEWIWPGSMEKFNYNGKEFLIQRSQYPETTLFLGDSNIEQYYTRVEELAKHQPERTNSVIFATRGGCLPVPASPYKNTDHCLNYMETALALAKATPEIKNVVIGGVWNFYLARGDNLYGDFHYGSAQYRQALQRLGTYLAELKSAGKQVHFILNIPIGDELDPKYMAQRSLKNFPNIIQIKAGGITRQQSQQKYGAIEQDLRQLVQTAGVNLIDPFDYVCDKTTCASLDQQGEPIYKDGFHFRPSYVRHQLRFLDHTMQH